LKTFPDFFPENCPPSDAIEKNINVFRYIENKPPSDDDFKSYYELNPVKHEGRVEAYGLSVVSNLESAKNSLNLNPGLRRKYKFIAKGTVTPDSGVIKNTPSQKQKYHMTWWLYQGVKPASNFTVCDF